MSRGIASLREATQGLACSLLKTFTAILPDPTDCPLVSEDLTFHETFLIFCGVSRKEATKFSRSEVPFSDQEVCCDWSTFLTARFNRRSLGKDCVTSQKNVFVTCVWEATKFSHFGWSLRLYFLLFAWFTVLISILFTSYFIASSLAQTQCDRIVWDWQNKSPFIYHLSQFNYERVCFNLRELGKHW